MSSIFSARAAEQEENHWLSVSDLMAGLMVMFLFISIALMRDVIISADKMREVAIAYQQSQVDIYNALITEFEDDLQRWDAAIDQDTLTFTFQSPDVLFERGEITLSKRYQELLCGFFSKVPRSFKPL